MLIIGKCNSEWNGWLYCTNKKGISGWVPQEYVLKLSKSGKILYDFDSTELTAFKDETVNVLNEVSEWCYCLNNKGEKGWIPKEHLEPIVLD
ncbi:MAG: SH3 domain-containing protein [Candidatus Lokiarchaeota archaeon]